MRHDQGYAPVASSACNNDDEELMVERKHAQPVQTQKWILPKPAFLEKLAHWPGRVPGRHNWKLGLYAGLCACSLVLLANITFLVIGASTDGGFADGIGTIAKGQSDDMIRLSSAYHLFINVCSTVLLTSSNYAMQLLCAPTRAEINQAHRHGQWLEIGLMSFRNIRFIDSKRARLWTMLVLSSAPLHLLYNSSVFHVVAGQDFTVTLSSNDTTTSNGDAAWDKLSTPKWQQIYSTKYNGEYGDLVLLVDKVAMGLQFYSNWTFTFGNPKSSSCDWTPVYYAGDGFSGGFSTNQFLLNSRGKVTPPASWQANERAVFDIHDFSTVASRFPAFANASQTNATTQDELLVRLLDLGNVTLQRTIRLPYSKMFTVTDDDVISNTFKLCPGTGWMKTTLLPFRIKDARARRHPYGSKVQVALPFLCVVIFSNLTKVICLALTIRSCSTEHIVTIGDAVMTFLNEPELTSEGRCVYMTPSVFERDFIRLRDFSGGLTWRSRRLPMLSLLGGTRVWSMTVIVVSTSATLWAILAAASSSQSLKSWGTASPSILGLTSTTFDAQGTLQTAILANAPQICLSLIYFSINRICTSMCFMEEWNSYATDRKALRVTQPSGEQRSTYFLQLPYRWAVPLTVTSGLLHWLLSQSLFLVRREMRNRDGSVYPESTCACGYSMGSLLAFTCVFFALLLTVLALSVRRVQVRVPPARHRSTVISAACHPPEDDTGCHLKQVQWGVTKEGNTRTIGHCTFTSKTVTGPREGYLYA